MPEILVLRQPEDEVYDRIPVSQSELGATVEDIYQRLEPEHGDPDYSIEILYDESNRAQH